MAMLERAPIELQRKSESSPTRLSDRDVLCFPLSQRRRQGGATYNITTYVIAPIEVTSSVYYIQAVIYSI